MISTPPSDVQERSTTAAASAPAAGSRTRAVRVRSQVNTTGRAASPITRPATIRITVPSVWDVSPDSSHQRGRTNKKYKTPAATEKQRRARPPRQCGP